ncbi:hypothetical protein MUK42_18905 [Musa troglodytarum]|uniref:Secreted protein n=1 Tax=Musa troglodytarum TaxID=320322 RepID=A0A9E7G2V9_9LILI|nr:hypothetical protein MUK42_18905 [Musa troglodytarum]
MRPRTAPALSLFVVFLVVSITVVSIMKRADAARPAPDCTAGWSYMADASTDEKGREEPPSLARWTAKLSHGPSPKGPGHR